MSREMKIKNLRKLNAQAIDEAEVIRWGKRGKAHFDKLVAEGLARIDVDEFDDTIRGYAITEAGEKFLAKLDGGK